MSGDQQKIISTASKVPARVKAIGGIIVEVNKLVAFPMTGEDLKDWAIDIFRLAPNVEEEALRVLMDAFKTEVLVWDKTKGIQNIFNGLKKIRKTEKGFEVMRRTYS